MNNIMARHRINEDGHMIWFDSDEEYYSYLLRKDLEEAKKRRIEQLRILEEKKKERRAIWNTVKVYVVLSADIMVVALGRHNDWQWWVIISLAVVIAILLCFIFWKKRKNKQEGKNTLLTF